MLPVQHNGVLAQNKCVFFKINEPFLAHLRKLSRQSAAVDAQIFGQFYAPERDREASALLVVCFRAQIGEDFIAQRALGNDRDLVHQPLIFFH